MIREKIKPTPEEKRAIASLKRLAKNWPETLWLFSASGQLNVMKRPPDGDIYRVGESVDPDASLAVINIPNDGGDW